MSTVDLTRWGKAPPKFILLLASAVSESSRANVARRIGISRSAVSTLLSNRYPSPSTKRIERKILETLGQLNCPTLGSVSVVTCFQMRERPFISTNAQAITQFKACANCQHNPNRRGESQ